MKTLFGLGLALAAVIFFTIMMPVSAQVSTSTDSLNDPNSYGRGMFQIKGVISSYSTSTAAIGLNGFTIPIRYIRMDQGVSLQSIAVGERVQAWGEIRNGYPVVTRLQILANGNQGVGMNGNVQTPQNETSSGVLRSIEAKLGEIRDRLSQILGRFGGRFNATSTATSTTP